MPFTVTLRAFARIGEILGKQRELELPDAARVCDAWVILADEDVELRALRASTRFARNGMLCTEEECLAAGDELSLLPPLGGG